MLNCRQSVALMSQAQDRRLSLRERLGLALHLALCGGCRNAGRHLRFIRDACAAWLRREE